MSGAVILVLNCGSSSIKFAAFDAATVPRAREPLWNGKVQGIGGPAPDFGETGVAPFPVVLDAQHPYRDALRLIRDVSPTSQLSLNLESQKVNFDDREEVDYSRDQAFLRYTRKLAHLDLDASAGWSRIRFQRGYGSVSDPMGRIALTWHASTRNEFGIAYTRSYSDAAQDLINLAGPPTTGTPTSPPLGIQTGVAVIGSGVYLEQRLEGHYDYSNERLTASLSPWYNKLHYLEGLQPDQTGRGGAAGLDYRISPRLTASAFANIERVTYTTLLGRRDTTTNIGVAVRQFMNSHWSWRASLVNRRRTSSAPGQGYRANEVYVGFVYQR